ncbi:hypothetical protein SAMN03159505_05023 [Pseudomonas sp. NFACC10-1]|nr:hypothetical protein SAMN03159505_05023 [Pseudomonas sp. NFACC10-1]
MEFSGGVLRDRVTWALNRQNFPSVSLIGSHCLKPLVFSRQVAARLWTVSADPPYDRTCLNHLANRIRFNVIPGY